MSWGYSWVFPGFVKKWKEFIGKYGFNRGLYLWKKFMTYPFAITKQIELTKFIGFG
jgi:hypothetical protein